MITIEAKYFSELSTDELYALLQLRSEVFVVEQNCVYQDSDYKDQKALHILGYKGEKLVAYTRLFKGGDYFEYASIGRVVVQEDERKFGYGHDIIKASVTAISEEYRETTIKISAQTYLKKFYESHGFKQVGEGYLEDGIPHIHMIR